LVHNWAPHRYFFFAAKFSKPFKNKGIAINDTLIENTATAKGTNLKAHFDFKTEENEVIMVKVAVSSVSTEGAIKNLDAEIADWDFDAVKSNARKAWNAELAKTYAQFNDTAVRKTFYTSLYRTMLSPVTHADVDSSYRGSDNNIHKGNHKNYHIYSLWDTFRALHPWLTITQPQRVNDMIQSMLAIFNESGHLPVWHFGNGENNCMIGFHAMPVITDAYLKGLTNIDGNKILNAMIYDIHGNGSIAGTDSFKQDAGGVFTKNAAIYGTKLFHQYGFIPGDIANAAVSRTLEYTYNNYNVYQMAKAMNNDTARYFQKCAGYYKNVFDSQCGFMRGKNAQGLFYNTGFKPEKQDWGWWVGPEHSEYVEGSGWQWLWFVPHDISGLIELLGGREATAKKLDTYFDRSTKGEETDEASGYIGQHAQGNEPGHHTPYLYNYVGQPWKSQKIVRDLMAETYSNKPDGLSGNDDCGQMSAWYVFSALGFYPVNASGGLYVFGSPAVKSASINVGNGKTFKIETKNYAPQNIYIQKVWLNGNEYNKTWISHADIVSGSKLVFEMGKEPNINWGINPEACPPISVY
jgi:predicted alpha-1,2-mannosidase